MYIIYHILLNETREVFITSFSNYTSNYGMTYTRINMKIKYCSFLHLCLSSVSDIKKTYSFIIVNLYILNINKCRLEVYVIF